MPKPLYIRFHVEQSSQVGTLDLEGPDQLKDPDFDKARYIVGVALGGPKLSV